MTDKFETYLSAQSWFAKNKDIYQSGRTQALDLLNQKCAEVMNVERVGIWFFDVDRDSICEETTFIKNQNPSSGMVLRRADYPKYFQHIEEERVLVSNDTLKDPVMQEFLESYLIPLQVRALLDCPIFSDGELIGIVCIEQLNKVRDWDIHDKNFAVIFSDFIARLVENEKRHIYENELRHRINYLENDLKKKLDALKEAKLSLDLALEAAQVGKWEWHIGSNKLFLNETWYSKLGYEFNEIPQSMETFKKLIHPKDFERIMEEVQAFISGRKKTFECRYRMLMKNGDVQWCLDRGNVIDRDASGQPTKVIGVNVNITPIVQWEQSLTISEQQLKSMIQSLPTPVAMFDRDFNYLAFSSKWPEQWGNMGYIVEGLNIRSEFRPEWVQLMEKALEGENLERDEHLVNFYNGKQLWLRWAIRPWKNLKGEIDGVIVMAENISARKEAEMKLTQASKLSALGEMAGGIAHEINNPLSIIKGYIDLLARHTKRKTLGPELLEQYIQKMDLTVARISRIVNGMRRFARESSLDEKVNYSLNKIVEETLDICQERIINRGTSVHVKYLTGESEIYCRPVEISQVLLNLINNSFQAISNYPHPWIQINLLDLGQIFRIEIIDCGETIPEAVSKKLFQPFFTTKDIGVGTGLGLSISRGIIEEHNGHIYYKDNAPHTTFIIELPKYHQEVFVH